ncbi:hypothetical protein VFPPC_17878 [Pochonia chlamydosporia 170]|uniref:Uncharacterized protein n=1 Tax=Pochonia chlamydosporia 170 TaxID=1380566 RepID=A0A219AQP8_METCM|nr:hypothetical protein VFPPC_17878 [Pochonia chlamydosporia 170]OWT42929.1 hypothetical protein VFPPC_17878 [Pochonia chlamydosporia 170]
MGQISATVDQQKKARLLVFPDVTVTGRFFFIGLSICALPVALCRGDCFLQLVPYSGLEISRAAGVLADSTFLVSPAYQPFAGTENKRCSNLRRPILLSEFSQNSVGQLTRKHPVPETGGWP